MQCKSHYVFVGACVLAIAGSAHAVVITNTGSATTLHDSGGFENDVVGTTPSNATVGEYSNTGLPLDEVVTGGVPGAFSGANYASTTRNGGAGNIRHFYPGFNPETGFGNTIHHEFMMWVGTSEDAAIILESETGALRVLLRAFGSGPLQNYNGAAYNTIPGMDAAIVAGQWQKWEIDHTIGLNSVTVSIDGVTGTDAQIATGYTGLGQGIRSLSFGHNSSTTYYLDAVPEPASLVLLAFGGLGLLSRRRRSL